MIAVTAPGLPPHPKLLFDSETKQAKVSFRHPTWRGHERALMVTEVLIWTLIVGVVWQVWRCLPSSWPMPLNFLISAAGAGFVFPIAQPTMRQAIPGFIARQIFATRTTLWFSPEAIAFRSHRYKRPILLWRTWNHQPLRVQFLLQPDREAEASLRRQDPKRKLSTDHFHEARVLEVVIGTSDRRLQSMVTHQGPVLRSIPLTELGGDLATKVTMVLAAAVTMTSAVTATAPGTTQTGQNIDA